LVEGERLREAEKIGKIKEGGFVFSHPDYSKKNRKARSLGLYSIIRKYEGAAKIST